MRRPKSIMALALALIAASFSAAAQSEFPFDRDLVFDARPMRGGRNRFGAQELSGVHHHFLACLRV